MLINLRTKQLQEVPDPLSQSLKEFADYIINTDTESLLEELNSTEDGSQGLNLTAEGIEHMKESYAHYKEEYWRI